MEWDKVHGSAVDPELEDFLQYLVLTGTDFLDLERMEEDVRCGVSLRSNIPIGYGLGSSGALCAAVYDRYALKKTASVEELISIFGLMEAKFHGRASGADALVSYLDKAVYKTDQGLMLGQDGLLSEKWTFFLLDSQQSRSTKAYVETYLNSIRLEAAELEGLVRELLEAILEGKESLIGLFFSKISKVQYTLFGAMIPDHIKKIWATGLEGDQFYLKLCGAGGGGYFLGLCKNDLMIHSEPTFFDLPVRVLHSTQVQP